MPPLCPQIPHKLIMEPIELFDNVFFDRIGFFAAFCGAAIMRKNYKPSRITAWWMTVNGCFLLWSIYTFVYYDRITMWKLLTIFGLGVQGFVKFVSVISYAGVIHRCVWFVRGVYEANQRANTGNYAILARSSRTAWQLCRYGAVLINSTCILLVPLTVLTNWVLDEHELPMAVFIPLIDERTSFGWAFMFAFDSMLAVLGGIGTCAIDLLLLMLVMQMWPLCEILRSQFAQLDEALRDEKMRHTVRVRWYFRNMLLIHKDICGYLTDISDAYFYIIFTEIYTIGLSLCALIFCSLTMTWIHMYFITALMLAKLLGFCLLGTIVELTTDHILSSIMASDWYLLPTEQQLMFQRMLAMAQKPVILRAGTIPVNLDTFVTVIKTVYTVGMLLIETVEA